ncbi:MAG: adenylate kinase family protein, partial [Pyrinomonadaceae bacterium]
VDVPRGELMKRLTGRRSCTVCGEIYNVYSRPPKREGFCDFHPETPLDHRADDWEEKVKVRLETYDDLTKPLLAYYENSGRLKKIDGTGEVEAIYRELNELV